MSAIQVRLITINALRRRELSIGRRLYILSLRISRSRLLQGRLDNTLLILRNSVYLVWVEDLDHPNVCL